MIGRVIIGCQCTMLPSFTLMAHASLVSGTRCSLSWMYAGTGGPAFFARGLLELDCVAGTKGGVALLPFAGDLAVAFLAFAGEVAFLGITLFAGMV
jgi:hypothetical protein